MAEASSPASADNNPPPAWYLAVIERSSAAILQEVEKMRREAADLEARFASFRVRPPEAQRVTEAEWQASTDPERMLREVGPGASGRKLQLFTCACSRRVWDGIDPFYRGAVEVTEKYLEGETTGEEYQTTLSKVGTWAALHRTSYECGAAEEAAACLSYPDALEGAISCVQYALASSRATRAPEAAAQAALVRCVFGNPFRPAEDAAGWRTDDALGLSRRAYESQDFALMPILADALEDAGCRDEEILNHCRQPGKHVRGCWVLDKLLGKE